MEQKLVSGGACVQWAGRGVSGAALCVGSQLRCGIRRSRLSRRMAARPFDLVGSGRHGISCLALVGCTTGRVKTESGIRDDPRRCSGGGGNLIDRVRYGHVVDFIDLYVGNWHWPAFNVADMAITIGAGLVILDSIGLLGRNKD